MGVVCNTSIEEIFDNECLSDSLLKINNNFLNLENSICELRQRVDARVEVRTFFYYGPNATTNPASGMADGTVSRPSDMTIQTFVNSPTELNLPAISKPNDIAYVIYQKTGFLSNSVFGSSPGSVVVTNQILTPGAPTGLSYGIWYDVKDYFSASAFSNGLFNALGTITLSFRPSVNAPSIPFVYRASGRPAGKAGIFGTLNRFDDTYVEWDQNNIIYSEGTTNNKVAVRTQSRPFRGFETAQFRFDFTGGPIARNITAIRKNATFINPNFQTTPDINYQFSPVFIIWRLTCQDSLFYTVDTGFPKFSRAQQSASGNASTWNAPQIWSEY